MILMSVGMHRTWSLYFMLQLSSNFINIGINENLYIPASTSDVINIMKLVSFFKLLNLPIIKNWLKVNVFNHSSIITDFFTDFGEEMISMVFFFLVIAVVVTIKKFKAL